MSDPEAERVRFSRGASLLVWLALLFSLFLLLAARSSWSLDLRYYTATFAVLPESMLLGASGPAFYPVIALSNVFCAFTVLLSATTFKKHLLYMHDRTAQARNAWPLVAIMYALRLVCITAFHRGPALAPYQPILARHGPALAVLFFPAFNVTLVLAMIVVCCSLAAVRLPDPGE